ncbi:MAG TPA: RNA polymerase factor sigma-32 [Candidatus Eisenbacteria bacterium]|nr:RNA polymerase factor sigma-32 [Candidatus Eisenbacteria bacterium]
MADTRETTPIEAEVVDEIADGEAGVPVPAPEPELDAEAKSVAPAGALVPLDNLQKYLGEIRRIPVLTREQEHELAVRWKEKGDRTAAWSLVTANLRLVVMIARDYQRAVHNLLDLVQEGNVGLLEAVKQFDPYRGVRFPSYAVWWIRAYIIRYIMNNWRMVKVGTTQAQRKLFFNLQKERERLEREGFSPEPKLIADRLGVKESEVVEMEQRLSARDLSVNAPIGDDDGDTTFLDLLAGPQQTAETVADEEYHQLIREKAAEFKKTLSGKDLVIYERRLEALMRDDDPATLQEIGDEYGITRERVRQIESRLKKRLGAYLREQIPDIRDVEFGA